TTGKDLWHDCVHGDRQAFKSLREYNAHDVWLLERVFQRLKPYAALPDLRVYTGAKECCPSCLSKQIQRRGASIARTRRYQRFHCQNCGKWFSGDLIHDEDNDRETARTSRERGRNKASRQNRTKAA